MMKTKIRTIFIISIILFVTIPTLAFGYIDPGTGNYLLQILIATLLGSALTLKIFWQRVKTFFVNVMGRKQK
ncbi:MAG: hypothetical protein JXJ04_18980 [Spirochaetales bacterium]|nr:hypothetical protein [Spirochaetales bacterium]